MRLEIPESLQLREQTLRAALANTESKLDREPELVSRHLVFEEKECHGQNLRQSC